MEKNSLTINLIPTVRFFIHQRGTVNLPVLYLDPMILKKNQCNIHKWKWHVSDDA